MESTTQIFLRVQVSEREKDFVKGEVHVGRYEDRILLDSFEFGMKGKLQAPPKPDQKVSSNLDFDPVQVTKVFDRSSLRLASLLQGSTELHEVRITVDQQLEDLGAGKAQNAIVVFHLHQAKLVDIRLDVTEADASASVRETLSFSFRNFAVEYYFSFPGTDSRDAWEEFKTDYAIQD